MTPLAMATDKTSSPKPRKKATKSEKRKKREKLTEERQKKNKLAAGTLGLARRRSGDNLSVLLPNASTKGQGKRRAAQVRAATSNDQWLRDASDDDLDTLLRHYTDIGDKRRVRLLSRESQRRISTKADGTNANETGASENSVINSPDKNKQLKTNNTDSQVNWSNVEIELIVDDYFEMLEDEVNGRSINKAAHNRTLLPKLNGRSRGSIEFKHCNISAVLSDSGRPIIEGYQPRPNVQKLLVEIVNEKWFASSFNTEEVTEQVKAAAWIFQANPDRYDIVDAVQANRRDVWATNQHRTSIVVGDKVYFYHSGNNAGIYAIGRVVSLPFEREEASEFGQWAVNVEYENLLLPYVRRDELLDDVTLRDEKRGEVKVFERYQGTNWPLSDAASQRLEMLVSSRNLLRVTEPTNSPFDLELSGSEPDRVTRSIMQRRGQKNFRDKLLKAYGDRCAVTGDGPTDVLEAAHIEPYASSGLNHHTNGLLLRADIHTLFDLDLIRINPDNLQVETTAELNGSSYSVLAGTKLRERLDGQTPSHKLLSKRYQSSASK